MVFPIVSIVTHIISGMESCGRTSVLIVGDIVAVSEWYYTL